MIKIIKAIYYEICSYFIPQKVYYKITGECKQCGKCCNYMYSYDTYSEKEFKIMQFLYPAYKRFYIKGKDEDGNLIFACKLVTPEGKCSVYNKRLAMCKRYPVKKLKHKAILHEGCGYKVHDISFKNFLKEKEDH